MLNQIKNYFIYKSVDVYIKRKQFDIALNKLNFLISQEFMLAETFLKRGKLCHELLMTEDAYNDYTYVINNCEQKENAYIERMKLNYEIGNYFETISDSNKLLEIYPDEFEYKKYKFHAFLFAGQTELAKTYIISIFDNNKYQTLYFLFNDSAALIATDEYSKALRILEVIELIDPNNPLKIYNEANIYKLAGNVEQEQEMRKTLLSAFPKYFISHFRFTDIYEYRDPLEISFLSELKIFDTQNCFAYPLNILEGYINHMNGKISESKESFEKAITINPDKPEAYVLLAETLQIMSGYDNPEYKLEAEKNYRKAMEIYERENLVAKTEDMKRQIKHLNSTLSF